MFSKKTLRPQSSTKTTNLFGKLKFKLLSFQNILEKTIFDCHSRKLGQLVDKIWYFRET